jgi:hypothetical protein
LLLRRFFIFETAFVEISLLRVGMWVNSPSILREIATKGASTSELPKYRKASNRNHCYPSSLAPEITSKEVELKEGAYEVYDQYTSLDKIRFSLLEIGSLQYMEAARVRLQHVIDEIIETEPNPKNPLPPNPSASPFRVCCR